MPSGIKDLGDSVFCNCIGLTSVDIPNGINSIGDYAFAGCTGLTSINIPDHVFIKKYAFKGCSNLEYIKIGNSGGDTESYTIFEDCPNIREILFDGNYVPSIFQKNSSIEKVTMSNNVTSIGDHAFLSCSNLVSVTIPSSVTSISRGAFEGCKSLVSIDMPNSVTSIENNAFSNCGLTSIKLPNSLTTIGELAFYKCIGLTSLTLPNTVTKIGESAFGGNNLTSLTVYSETHPSIAFVDCKVDSLIFHCKEIRMKSVKGKIIIIGDEVTRIHDRAFCDNSVTTSVLIGSGLKNLGSEAFRNCREITSIILDNVTSVGSQAFEGCKKLTSVILGNSLLYIGNRAFKGCRMTSITIPATVKSIDYGAFENVPLDNVVLLIENPFPIEDELSSIFTYHSTLYVPIGTVEKYKTTKGWKDFFNIKENPNETGIKSALKESNNMIIHSLRGEKLNNPSKGINIIKMKDGTAKKVFVK